MRYASIALKEASSAAIASSMLIAGLDDDGVGDVGSVGFVVGFESCQVSYCSGDSLA